MPKSSTWRRRKANSKYRYSSIPATYMKTSVPVVVVAKLNAQ
jgi:hypothetical protein